MAVLIPRRAQFGRLCLASTAQVGAMLSATESTPTAPLAVEHQAVLQARARRQQAVARVLGRLG
jgi:hypothetical protein